MVEQQPDCTPHILSKAKNFLFNSPLTWARWVSGPTWWEEVYRCASVCKSGRSCCHNTAQHVQVAPFSTTIDNITKDKVSPTEVCDCSSPLQWFKCIQFPCETKSLVHTRPKGLDGYSRQCRNPNKSLWLTISIFECSIVRISSVCMSFFVCEEECWVTLTAKLHFPLRTASSSVCHWCGRLDSGT